MEVYQKFGEDGESEIKITEQMCLSLHHIRQSMFQANALVFVSYPLSYYPLIVMFDNIPCLHFIMLKPPNHLTFYGRMNTIGHSNCMQIVQKSAECVVSQ